MKFASKDVCGLERNLFPEPVDGSVFVSISWNEKTCPPRGITTTMLELSGNLSMIKVIPGFTDE